VQHSKIAPALVRLGSKRESAPVGLMSASTSCGHTAHELMRERCHERVRCNRLFDHLVGEGKERGRHVKSKRLGGLEIDH